MKFEYTYTRLNVANYQACKEFYQDVLGFEVVFADDKDEYTELATGQTKITIFNRQQLGTFVNSSEPVSYDPDYAGVVLSFKVSCLDDAISHLKNQGVKMVKKPMNYPRWGFISAFFRDPDGNLIEARKCRGFLGLFHSLVELEELNSYPNF